MWPEITVRGRRRTGLDSRGRRVDGDADPGTEACDVTEQNTPTSGELGAAISTAVVHMLAETTGRGPTKAKTTLGENGVFVVLQDNLTKGERRGLRARTGCRCESLNHSRPNTWRTGGRRRWRIKV
jgi:Na+-translocating membrane potential-generating system MpsC-like protein